MGNWLRSVSRRLLAVPAIALIVAGGVAVAAEPALADNTLGCVTSASAARTCLKSDDLGFYPYIEICDVKADGHHVEGGVNWYSWDRGKGGYTGDSNYNGNGRCVTAGVPLVGCDIRATLTASVWEGGTRLSSASRTVNLYYC